MNIGWKYILVIVIVAALCSVILLYQEAIPFPIPWINPANNEDVIVLNELEEETGILFSKIEPVEFDWDIKKDGAIESIAIDGKQFETEEPIAQSFLAEIKGFLEDKGFEPDFYNMAAGTMSEMSGYKKEGLVCILTSAISLDSGLISVEIKCGQGDIGIEPLTSTEEAIKELLAEKYGTKTSAVAINIEQEQGDYVKGSAYIADPLAQNGAGDYGIFLAAKIGGKWELVSEGAGVIVCTDVAGYDFPAGMIGGCVDFPFEPDAIFLEEGVKNQVGVGDSFSVILETNPTTGYQWEPEFDSEFIVLVDRNYLENPHTEGMVGVGGTETFNFIAKSSGDLEISFSYFRSWESKDTAIETKIFEVEIR